MLRYYKRFISPLPTSILKKQLQEICVEVGNSSFRVPKDFNIDSFTFCHERQSVFVQNSIMPVVRMSTKEIINGTSVCFEFSYRKPVRIAHLSLLVLCGLMQVLATIWIVIIHAAFSVPVFIPSMLFLIVLAMKAVGIRVTSRKFVSAFYDAVGNEGRNTRDN